MARMIAAIAVLVFTMGCGGASDEASQGAANHAEDAAKAAYGEAEKAVDAAVKSGVEVVNEAVTAANTLTGTTGCGHCDFQVSDGCTAAIKTTDGKLYVLDGIDPESELFQNRMKGNEVTIKGEIQTVDGQPHVEVASFEMM